MSLLALSSGPNRYDSETILDRKQVCTQLSAEGVDARYLDDVDTIVDALEIEQNTSGVVLILSNGSFDGIYAKIQIRFPN